MKADELNALAERVEALAGACTKTDAATAALSALDLPAIEAAAEARGAARMKERCAAYLDGSDGKIPILSVFAGLVSGNNMPDMSADARNRLHSHARRRFDDAMRAVGDAIRALDEVQA